MTEKKLSGLFALYFLHKPATRKIEFTIISYVKRSSSMYTLLKIRNGVTKKALCFDDWNIISVIYTGKNHFG